MGQRWAVGLAAWVVCGCTSGDPPAAAPGAPVVIDAAAVPDAAPAPDAAPLTLEPAHLYTLPPVEDGWTRLAAYDVEYQPGPCPVAIDLAGRALGPGAAVSAPDLVLERRVGTLRMMCSGYATDRACVRAQCDSLRPVPGGSALEDYPSAAPMIVLDSAGGVDGRAFGGVAIWSDGTVSYHGPNCQRHRGRRGRLTPEAYRALIAAIDASGFATVTASMREQQIGLGAISDDVLTTLTVDGVSRQGGFRPLPAIGRAIAAVDAAVSPNPCE